MFIAGPVGLVMLKFCAISWNFLVLYIFKEPLLHVPVTLYATFPRVELMTICPPSIVAVISLVSELAFTLFSLNVIVMVRSGV